jgi:glyoxylase-like metal-dependent hydrolase (beta-lactamase superfamily II)
MFTMGRRAFLATGAFCLAHLGLMVSGRREAARSLFAREPLGSVVAQEPWGRLERLADGVWALVSTPLDDRTTLCNGGIVAGQDGLLVVESFASDRGARWMAEQARRLAGRWPTHVIVTHYHGDHSGGLAGSGGDADQGPGFHLSEATVELIRAADARREGAVSPARTAILAGVEPLDPRQETSLDLGGRTVRVVPRSGHTASDVTVELGDPSIVFCGDLVWNEMFPNYVDAVPSLLSAAVRGLRRERDTVYVPGHGPLADPAALDRYVAVLDHVESAARRAFDRGVPSSEAAEDFELPQGLGEWFLFNPGYFERALAAWERELGAP